MKKFEIPKMVVSEFEIVDVITVSDGGIGGGADVGGGDEE